MQIMKIVCREKCRSLDVQIGRIQALRHSQVYRQTVLSNPDTPGQTMPLLVALTQGACVLVGVSKL